MMPERRPEGMSLQERYGPDTICFGCGPANPDGLHVRSFPDGDEVVAEWRPEARHQAFPGVLNGGIVGTLLDCHMNWTAAWALMQRRAVDRPPTTVTAEYSVRLLRPTPVDVPLRLRARVVEASDDRATVQATLEAAGDVCDTARGTFVAVRPGHPAFGRW
jgi:acyl-coenzyme A thioesterase PaaI-like protein